MEFIDLFAGLGGFNLALRRLNHRCVFACEQDETLRKLYERNFGLFPEADIRLIPLEQIPRHDVLCAGFPCQPFSKAGRQEGLDDRVSGDLFEYVFRIASFRLPEYLILENVPNLERHDSGRTWTKMKQELEGIGYSVDQARLSPHRFGIPQIRDRLFIVGSRSGLSRFRWPTQPPHPEPGITSMLQKNPPDARPLSPQVEKCLETWQMFLNRFPAAHDLPSFPIWSMEFGATYPFEDATPFAVGPDRLRRFLGSHGRTLADVPEGALMQALPSHARVQDLEFPHWKKDFIRKNRALYEANKEWIDDWIPHILPFPSSLQKLEWNCKGEERNIWTHVIQFRASGVRVKRPTTAPSLIAMNTTQVPIIAWERRYMTPRECANLQSMTELQFLPDTATSAFRALGNAVNVHVVQLVAQSLLSSANGIQLLSANSVEAVQSQLPFWSQECTAL